MSFKIAKSHISPKDIETLRHDGSKGLRSKVALWRGDITRLKFDAIVNAANESLLGGGGVDGAIHAAAGVKLLEECKTVGGCKTGEAKITKGYKLPAKHVIHTVGPIGEDENELKNCYESSLDVLLENELKTVAFPCISTGIYGYPNEEAAHVALSTTQKWLQRNHDKVDLIVFCLFLQVDVSIYKELAEKYFPPHSRAVARGLKKKSSEHRAEDGDTEAVQDMSVDSQAHDAPKLSKGVTEQDKPIDSKGHGTSKSSRGTNECMDSRHDELANSKGASGLSENQTRQQSEQSLENPAVNMEEKSDGNTQKGNENLMEISENEIMGDAEKATEYEGSEQDAQKSKESPEERAGSIVMDKVGER